MSTYFSVLPRELLLELSLYFNYRDSILHCGIIGQQCDVKFWVYKIKYELGYNDEFIREYVYDGIDQTVKTLMPINEKYLELKARRGVDFGTEFYNNMINLIILSSRLKDTNYAIELTMYLLKIAELRHPELDSIRNIYQVAIRGIVSMGRIDFADQLIDQFYNVVNKSSTQTHEPNLAYDFNNYIVMGIYENGDLDLLNHYGINRQNIDTDYIIKGLSISGSVEKLRPYESSLNSNNLFGASQLNGKNIIQTYKWLLYDPDFLKWMIKFGNIELLPAVREVPEDIREDILIQFISSGYLEELVKYQDLLTPKIVKEGTSDCLLHNHIDTLNFIYKKFPNIKKSIYFEFKIKFSTISLCEYLLNSNIITIDQIQSINIDVSTLARMNKFNNDTLQYLLNFMPVIK